MIKDDPAILQLVDAALQHGRFDGQHRDRLPVARHLRRPRPLCLRRLPPLQVSHTRDSRNLGQESAFGHRAAKGGNL